MMILLLVLFPVLLPATITGFHTIATIADVRRSRRALTHAA
jgi:hypothetical protein